MSGIQNASNQSIKPFKSSEEYIYAMKEDLAEWLGEVYSIEIGVNNILEVLETGALLCAHANNVTRVADDFVKRSGPTRSICPLLESLSSALPSQQHSWLGIMSPISSTGVEKRWAFQVYFIILNVNERFYICYY